MTDYNMPPGTRVSDIPGNRPEDERADKFMESIEYLKAASGVTGTLIPVSQRLNELCTQLRENGPEDIAETGALLIQEFEHAHAALGRLVLLCEDFINDTRS